MKVDVLPAKLEVTRDEGNKVQSAVLKIGGQFAAPFKYVAWEVTLDDLAHLQPVEPKQGEWIEKPWGIVCSRCKSQALHAPNGKQLRSDFCPNCGSDNRKRGEAK